MAQTATRNVHAQRRYDPLQARARIFDTMALHHDLRSIVTPIKGYIYVARKMSEAGISPLNSHLLRHLDVVERHADSLKNILEKMVELYPLTHGPLDDRNLTTAEKRGYEEIERTLPEIHRLSQDLHIAAQTMHDVSGYADLKTDVHLPQAVQILRHIHEHSQHLFECVTDLLEAKVRPFRLNDVLKRLKTRYGGVSIHVPRSDIKITAREKQVERMYEQAIKNAIKVKASHIRVDTRTNTGSAKAAKKSITPQVTVTVSDSGPGIPTERQGIIFEPGKTFATAQDEEPGTGMGLAFARSVAQNAGGDVQVWSDPRQPGKHAIRTRFSFNLPMSGALNSRTGRKKRS